LDQLAEQRLIAWGGFAPGARLPSPGHEIILGKMIVQ
jgi:hypothetical protein